MLNIPDFCYSLSLQFQICSSDDMRYIAGARPCSEPRDTAANKRQSLRAHGARVLEGRKPVHEMKMCAVRCVRWGTVPRRRRARTGRGHAGEVPAAEGRQERHLWETSFWVKGCWALRERETEQYEGPEAARVRRPVQADWNKPGKVKGDEICELIGRQTT